MRYVTPLTTPQQELLEQTRHQAPSPRARARAHSLLLSAQGRTIPDIAQIYQVDRDTVAAWITKWEQQGEASLYDRPRSGRPPKLTPAEQALAQEYVKETPQSLKQVGERLAKKTGKHLSLSTLKRLAKKAGLGWKRVRKSLKSLRDPAEFARCQRELQALQKQEDQGKIDLYYFDEAGFALASVVPYAWQALNTVIELPALKAGRINVLGFLTRDNAFQSYMFEQSIDTDVVVACFEAFCQTLTKPTVVVIDNASIHTSDEFEERLPEWKKHGLRVQYLSTYSPELNRIEILWRRIKYTWLPFSAYHGLNALRLALENILSQIGSKYQITFA